MLTAMAQQHFHKILLMGRPGVIDVPETLLALKDYLLSLNVELLIEKNTSSMMGKHKLPTVSTEKIPKDELEEFFILSDLTIQPAKEASASVTKTTYKKCARCWRHRPTVATSKAHPELCDRCENVVTAMTKSE